MEEWTKAMMMTTTVILKGNQDGRICGGSRTTRESGKRKTCNALNDCVTINLKTYYGIELQLIFFKNSMQISYVK